MFCEDKFGLINDSVEGKVIAIFEGNKTWTILSQRKEQPDQLYCGPCSQLFASYTGSQGMQLYVIENGQLVLLLQHKEMFQALHFSNQMLYLLFKNLVDGVSNFNVLGYKYA